MRSRSLRFVSIALLCSSTVAGCCGSASSRSDYPTWQPVKHDELGNPVGVTVGGSAQSLGRVAGP